MMMAENKMEYLAAGYGKKLDEKFMVKRDGCIFTCAFTKYGFTTFGAYENPYFDVDANVLVDLLTGEAVIVE